MKWTSNDKSVDHQFAYNNIAVHAVSRDVSSFQHECLFLLVVNECHDPQCKCLLILCQVCQCMMTYSDCAANEDNDIHDIEDGNHGDDEEEMSSVEIRIVPEDSTQCNVLHGLTYSLMIFRMQQK